MKWLKKLFGFGWLRGKGKEKLIIPSEKLIIPSHYVRVSYEDDSTGCIMCDTVEAMGRLIAEYEVDDNIRIIASYNCSDAYNEYDSNNLNNLAMMDRIYYLNKDVE